MLLHKLTIIIDQHGQPCGASIVTDFDGDRSKVLPVAVGPFDAAEDVLTDLLRRCRQQLRLW